MKRGHCWEMSREILAKPYPGRSAKTSSGRGWPGHRTSKKLMLRVRPGGELVRASLLPTSELITLDLPTLDRPRNAISGNSGRGKCAGSVAAVRNRVKTRIRAASCFQGWLIGPWQVLALRRGPEAVVTGRVAACFRCPPA